MTNIDRHQRLCGENECECGWSADFNRDETFAEQHTEHVIERLRDDNIQLREEYRLAHLDAIVNRDTANRAEKTIERVKDLLYGVMDLRQYGGAYPASETQSQWRRLEREIESALHALDPQDQS